MKKFLVVSLILFGLALILVVLVWYLLQGILFKEVPSKIIDDSINIPVEQVDNESTSTILKNDQESENVISLTPEQKQAAESIGIDSDSFTITDAMIDCAKDKLSESRMVEILNGDAPTVFETLTLLPCLRG